MLKAALRSYLPANILWSIAMLIKQTVSALAVFGLATLWSNPGMAEGAFAIGLPTGRVEGGFVYGIEVNSETSRSAQSGAMDSCRGINRKNNVIPDRASKLQAACKIVGSFKEQCAVMAHNGDQHTPATGFGWTIAPYSATAISRPVAQCDSMRQGHGLACKDYGALCDGDAFERDIFAALCSKRT